MIENKELMIISENERIFSYTEIDCSFFIVNSTISSALSKRISYIHLIAMDIFRINELTDDMMNLAHDEFYRFLETALSKELCHLFRVQAIRYMSSLSNVTIDEITHVLNFSIANLNQLKDSRFRDN